MKLTAGQVLQDGKYVLNDVLSQGGFGITYRATHSSLAQTVVIKTLHDNLRSHADFERFQQRFLAEARLLARFHHPNIVRVSDFFKQEGLPFIVMDYVPGKTLAEVISDHPLTEAQAIRYIRQVGAALDVIHQYGLLHRDVKPQNVILHQGTQSVVLIDFGIAREFTPGVTQTNTGLLSAGYAPIEQYLPQHRWTPATDVYALAATLYALLAGRPPIASILRDRIPLLGPRQLQPHLSPVVEQAILQGMALEANHRPQKIVDWLALLPHSAHEASTQQTSTSPGLNSPTLALTGATLPVYRSPSSKYRSKASATAASSPKLVRPPSVISKERTIRSPAKHPLRRALITTSIIAAIVGGGFGLALRFRGVVRPGFSPVNINESFPPKEMPGTTLPNSPLPVPLPEAAPTEEAPTGDQPLESPSAATIPPVEPVPIEPNVPPESTVPSPSQEDLLSPTSIPTPSPEPSTSISPTSEPTIDLAPPATQAPASSEPTPPASLPEQVPQVPAL
jgi:serine/threonine-protein kinase